MKEKLVSPQEESPQEESAALPDREKNYWRQRARDLVQEEVEWLDWQTGNPEKREKISARHWKQEIH
jgi:hypothetical protein